MSDTHSYVEHPVMLGADAVGIVVSPGRVQFYWRVNGEWCRELSEAETARLMSGKGALPEPPVQDTERVAWARLVKALTGPQFTENGLPLHLSKEHEADGARQALRDLGVDVDGLLREA